MIILRGQFIGPEYIYIYIYISSSCSWRVRHVILFLDPQDEVGPSVSSSVVLCFFFLLAYIVVLVLVVCLCPSFVHVVAMIHGNLSGGHQDTRKILKRKKRTDTQYIYIYIYKLIFCQQYESMKLRHVQVWRHNGEMTRANFSANWRKGSSFFQIWVELPLRNLLVCLQYL